MSRGCLQAGEELRYIPSGRDILKTAVGRAKKRERRQGQRPERNLTASPRKKRHMAPSAVPASLAMVALFAAALWVGSRVDDSTPAPTEPSPPDSGAAARYVEPAVCAGCHAEIWQTYRETGMARSFYRPAAANTIEDYAAEEPFYHEASDRYYVMTQRNGRYFQRRYQKGPQGRETNVLEKEIHFVMGSGNHARSYLNLSSLGKLTQLPLGWYSEDGGHWGMSPGYDRPNHDGFQRVISFDCMFCHNGYPAMEPGADRLGKRPVYRGEIPEGIDCQRCHGPGSAHVDAVTAGADALEAGELSIVNPGKLPARRQMEVCLQCHLETTSRPLPNIVRKYGRGYFSYRPGQPLADYALHFDHASNSGWDDKFEINHAAYRLRESKCFVSSGEAMTCTTCHDPHRNPGDERSSRQYDDACLACHEARLARLASAGVHPADSGCAQCHMPKRRTDDVVHAVMTDHLIQAAPPNGLLEPKREKSTFAETAYRGEVTLYYPESPSDSSDELYVALAQIAQGSNRDQGIARLRSALERQKPAEAGFYFNLAAALEESGRLDESVRWFEQALARDPGFGLARTRLGSVLSRAGNHREAQRVLKQAMELEPDDPRNPKERGLDFARQSMFEESAELAREAVKLDPDLPELHNNLGGALAELGRMDEAESAIRNAIRLQPDLAEARFNLGVILASRGDTDAAMSQWRDAIRSKTDHAGARYNLAVVLASGGDSDAAAEHLDIALQAEPLFERARILREQLRESR